MPDMMEMAQHMMGALGELADEDLVQYPEGHLKLTAALDEMGPMGPVLELSLLVLLL